MGIYSLDPSVQAILIPVLVFALSFHEFAHGWMANRLGDPTAKHQGRLTLNPLAHLDLMGTLMLYFAGFGWAKPVPVNFYRLKNPLRDMIIVAIAGPVTNVVLAFVAASILSTMHNFALLDNPWLVRTLANFFFINIILAVFNMIPIPPLDGGRVAVGLLPQPLSYQLARLERYGFFIIITALFVLPLIGKKIGITLEPIHWFIQSVSSFLISIIAFITGLQI